MTELLYMLKVDLGIRSGAYDQRLVGHLKNAIIQIEREGAVLNMDSYADKSLVVMYAAWTWRRRDTMEGMPRMLRWQLNNRIFAGKMADG